MGQEADSEADVLHDDNDVQRGAGSRGRWKVVPHRSVDLQARGVCPCSGIDRGVVVGKWRNGTFARSEITPGEAVRGGESEIYPFPIGNSAKNYFPGTLQGVAQVMPGLSPGYGEFECCQGLSGRCEEYSFRRADCGLD